MSEAHDLPQQLRTLVGSTVQQIGLWLLPDPDGPDETDVLLYIECQMTDSTVLNFVVGTAPDGQTPELDSIRLDGGQPLSALKERLAVWRSSRIGLSDSQSRELFLASRGSCDELSAMCGDHITAVYLVCFDGEPTMFTGIVFEFGSGRRLWSVPGSYGNAIRYDEVSEDYWPAPVVLAPVS